MKGSFFLPLLCIWVFIYSCTKDDHAQFTYNTTYHKSGVKEGRSFRVFSTHGEVINPDIVARFITDTNNFYNLSNALATSQGMMDSVKFPDPLRAKLYRDYTWVDCQVLQQVYRLILTRTDPLQAISIGEVFSRTLNYLMCQYKPAIFNEYLISSTRGNYEFAYSTFEQFTFKISGGQLEAPLILFSRHEPYFQIAYVNNFLQSDFYRNIPAGDTVGIMEYFIQYEK